MSMYDRNEEVSYCRRKKSKVHYEITNYNDNSCHVYIELDDISASEAEKLMIEIIDKFGSAVQKELDFKDPRFKVEKPVAGKFPWGEEQ